MVALGLAWAAFNVFTLGEKVPFSFEIAAPEDQTITLFYEGDWLTKGKLQHWVPSADKPQKITFELPRRGAENLRVGFGLSRGHILLKNFQLNHQPVYFAEAFYHEQRNIHSCEAVAGQPLALSCRLAGPDAYAQFPQQSTRKWVEFPWKTECIGLLACVFFLFLFQYQSVLVRLARRVPRPSATVLRGACVSAVPCIYFFLRYQVYQDALQAYTAVTSPDEIFVFLKWDAWAPAALLAGIGLCFLFKRKWMKWGTALITLGLLLILLADFILVQSLNARLFLFQAGDFTGGLLGAWPLVWAYVNSGSGLWSLGLAFCVGALLTAAFFKRPGRRLGWTLAVVAGLCGLLYLAPEPAVRLSPDFKDLPRLYWQRLHPVSSVDPSAQGAQEFAPTYRCEPGLNGRQNIILIIIESWSAYKSQFFSGLHNDTPKLDQLARENLAFTHYHTNNYNTVQSLFNLFSGYPLLHYYTDTLPLKNEKFYTRAVPKTFRKAGYHTALFSSASFVYSKDEVLRRAGFDELHNQHDPFYQGKERFIFNSVSDNWLYRRVEQWLKQAPKQPYFLVVETTTSHAPYMDPVSHQRSFPRTLRFADQAAADFIEQLQRDGFFEKGIVVVTGDHRALLPVAQEQYRALGATAESHVPLLVIGRGLHGVRTVPGSHIDLGVSLQYLALPQACFHPYQHNLFAEGETRNSCLLFQRLFFAKRALVTCGDQTAEICLNPNANTVCKGTLPPQPQPQLQAFMRWLRQDNSY